MRRSPRLPSARAAILLTALAARAASGAETAADASRDPGAHHLKLEITPVASPLGPWRLRVENDGTAPIRLIADARLVTMDVEPTARPDDQAAAAPDQASSPGKARAGRGRHPEHPHTGVAHCRLPPEMRPADEDDARALIVPPGRSYVETFDVRALCFGSPLDALTPGAKVTPHLGWPTKKGKRPRSRAGTAASFTGPAVVGPVDLSVPGASPVDSVAELDAPQVILAPPPVVDGMPVHPPSPEEDRDGDGIVDDHPKYDQHHHLVLSLPKYVDHESRVDIPAPLTLTNEGDRPRAVFYRASRVRFEVLSPVGERSTCGSPPDQTPLPEFYTHLKRGQAAHLAMLVSDVCDVDVFTRAGVYEVVAHVDDSGLSGANLGMSAFAGVLGTKPMLVRVRRESHHYELPRPRLE